MAKVLLECENGLAVITLNDPERRNALGLIMADELSAAAAAVAAREDVRAVIITGAGSAFCAGGDRRVLAEPTESALRAIYQAFLDVRALPQPTLAAVNGPAVGAGLNLALACDVRLAGRSAVFDPRFLQLPAHPGGGHLWMLQRVVGPQTAAVMAVFGQAVPGEHAARLNLAWACVDDESLQAEARRMCFHLAAAPGHIGPQIKRSLRRAAETVSHLGAMEDELIEQLDSMRHPEYLRRMEQFR